MTHDREYPLRLAMGRWWRLQQNDGGSPDQKRQINEWVVKKKDNLKSLSVLRRREHLFIECLPCSDMCEMPGLAEEPTDVVLVLVEMTVQQRKETVNKFT